jgi:hypothetical protein
MIVYNTCSKLPDVEETPTNLAVAADPFSSSKIPIPHTSTIHLYRILTI